jgi:membrane protease YdiL (CAAX protease family)
MSVFLEYAARGRTAWWLYPLAMVLALVLAAAAFVVIYLAFLWMGVLPPTLMDDLTHPNHPVVFFVGAGVEFGVVLVGFIAAIRIVHGKRLGDVTGRWPWRLVLLGAGIWFAVQVLGALSDFVIAPHSFKLSLSAGTPVLALSAFLGLAIQTFAEEYVFRGYLTQGLLLATRRQWVTAVISGLLFGALHIPNGTAQAVNAVFFGAVTAVLAIRTGGIAFTFGLHFINNVFGAVFVVSNSDVFRGSPGFFTQTAPQLLGWDVGVGVVALLVVLWFSRRLRPPAAPDPSEAFS